MKPAKSRKGFDYQDYQKQKVIQDIQSINRTKKTEYQRRQQSQQPSQISNKYNSQKVDSLHKQRRNMPKINSIIALAKDQQARSPVRPGSQQKKRQMKSIEKLIINKNISKSILETNKQLGNSKAISNGKDIKQKDLGMVWMNPQYDKLSFIELETTDPVYDKYYDMISNDSDTIFVMNAIPEIKPYKTEPSQNKIDFFMSHKMSRISGQFSSLTSQKVISILKLKPAYLDSKSKVMNQKITLSTKWKVIIDVGFVQYLMQPTRIVITRVYLSKIYRRMNYLALLYSKIISQLFVKYESFDKISIFLHDRNLGSIKFFKFLGGKIQRIFTDSTNKIVDYYQQFVCKKKDVFKALQKLQI